MQALERPNGSKTPFFFLFQFASSLYQWVLCCSDVAAVTSLKTWRDDLLGQDKTFSVENPSFDCKKKIQNKFVWEENACERRRKILLVFYPLYFSVHSYCFSLPTLIHFTSLPLHFLSLLLNFSSYFNRFTSLLRKITPLLDYTFLVAFHEHKNSVGHIGSLEMSGAPLQRALPLIQSIEFSVSQVYFTDLPSSV